MDNIDLNPSDTVPGVVDVATPAGSENGSNVSSDTLSLSEIQNITGRKYSSLEDARKGLKETYTYVGKKQETVKPMDTSNFASKEEIAQLKEENWYARHPEHEALREVISALSLKTGKPLEEVITLDSYKQVYDKTQGYDKIQSAKSVLESNPRLNATHSKMSEAKDMVKEAMNASDSVTAQRTYEAATQKVVESVLEAYDIR